LIPSATLPKRIALVGDVHANLPALEAVLAHASGQEVEAVWNIGDFLGYGAYPDETVKRLRKAGAISIIGNYDLKVLKFPRKDQKWRTTKHPLKWLAFKWAYEQLPVESIDYLRSLPEERILFAHGKHFLLVHGSPASNEEALYPDASGERLAELRRLAMEKFSRSFDAIVFGHSHQAFARRVEVEGTSTWFINTGSVGRPDDGDPRACYAVMAITSEGIQVEHFRVEYEVDRAVAAIREKGLPEAFAEMLVQGKKLEAVLE
jgi:putative phosphoesterase